MPAIPNHYHFIFGLKEQREPFHIAWYVALKSCLVINNPAKISFHFLHEPHGHWWNRIKPHLNLVRLTEKSYFDRALYNDHHEGRFIQRAGLEYAHQSDFIRLSILKEHGGVYADIDTLFVKPYPAELLSQECVMGREQNKLDEFTLCNAVIMAAPGSIFIEKWLGRMHEVFDGTWNRHSCVEPAHLARCMGEHILLLPSEHFFYFSHTTQDLMSLFGRNTDVPDAVCSIHLWSHLWWDTWRTDYLNFHHRLLTERFIREVDTTYNLIARRVLD